MRHAHRLLDRHEALIENSRSRKLGGIRDQRLAHSGDNIDFAVDQKIESRVGVSDFKIRAFCKLRLKNNSYALPADTPTRTPG